MSVCTVRRTSGPDRLPARHATAVLVQQEDKALSWR